MPRRRTRRNPTETPATLFVFGRLEDRPAGILTVVQPTRDSFAHWQLSVSRYQARGRPVAYVVKFAARLIGDDAMRRSFDAGAEATGGMYPAGEIRWKDARAYDGIRGAPVKVDPDLVLAEYGGALDRLLELRDQRLPPLPEHNGYTLDDWREQVPDPRKKLGET